MNALALNLPALSMPATDISQLQFLPPAPPSTDAPSGRARGGASRGGCAQVQSQLTALSPVAVTSQQRTSVWGLTTVAQPTLWAYMPYTQGQSVSGDFVLQDSSGVSLARVPIILPDQPGAIGIKVSSVSLKVGQPYRWFINVFCDPQKQLPPVSINGSIQRVALTSTLAHHLTIRDKAGQAVLYAQQGIWYDLLTTLAQLRRSSPQMSVYSQSWKSLIQSIGQAEVADAPIVN